MSFRICPECGAENTSYHCDECGRVERTPEQIALDVAVMQREPALTRDRDRLATEVKMRIGMLAANLRVAALEEMRVRAAVDRVRDMWSLCSHAFERIGEARPPFERCARCYVTRAIL